MTLPTTVLLSLALLLPAAAARAADVPVGAAPAPGVAAGPAAGALPATALPLHDDERAELDRAQASDAGDLAAIRGGLDDHDLTLILGTALVVVIIAILL